MNFFEKATTNTLIIVVVSMVISIGLTIAFGFFAGMAGYAFSYILFLMLDSIDENLFRLASVAESQAKKKNLAETYTSQGEKVDLKA